MLYCVQYKLRFLSCIGLFEMRCCIWWNNNTIPPDERFNCQLDVTRNRVFAIFCLAQMGDIDIVRYGFRQ